MRHKDTHDRSKLNIFGSSKQFAIELQFAQKFESFSLTEECETVFQDQSLSVRKLQNIYYKVDDGIYKGSFTVFKRHQFQFGVDCFEVW